MSQQFGGHIASCTRVSGETERMYYDLYDGSMFRGLEVSK
jgi:hypothetical protein